MQSEIVAALNTSNNNLHQHRRKTAHGVGVGFPQANNTQLQGSSTSNINVITGSHSQVPPLQINTNNIGIGLANGGLGTSVDSRGNQSTSSNNGVQIISRKFIHFIGNNNNNSAASQQQTARANTHSQKRHNNAGVGILPLNQLINNQNEQSSPRDIIDSNFMNPPASNRSGRSNGKGGIAEMLQSNRNNNSGGATIQFNGRASQRKSNGVVKMPGSNAVSAPHHQLGYRRHQIMDITDDTSNLASKNKLNGVYGTQGNNGNEETLNSQESDRVGEQPSSMQNSNDGPAAYSMFYHTNQNQLTALATSGEVINRFNSKKNLKLKKQQQDQQLELNSPYSAVFPGAPYVQNGSGGPVSAGPFQFTRKQNMMNADNSLSATRETAIQGGVKVIKLKKPQPIKISLHRDSMQSINAPSNSIGKRRPLIIRKNNYISGQGGSNERGSHKDMTNDTSPFNKTSNFNTLISSGNNHGSSNVRLNNTSSFVGLSSEVSLSQTAGQIKNQTAAVAGISHILKTLNQTVPSEENLAVLQQLPGTNSHKLSQLTLKDAKLIRTNMSKKRLDTARKSRLHQMQVVTDPYHPGEINSLSQQPPESRQPNPLSQMMKKKRSLLPKSGKNANETQGSDVVVQTISSNGGGGSLHNMLIHRPSERGSRRETQRAQLTTAQNDNQRDSSHHNMPNDQTTTKMTSKSEERTIITDHSAPMLQQQQSANNAKMLSRGQIMRLQKQKQQIQLNTASNEVKNPDAKFERSPMNQGLNSSNRNLNSNKSSKSLTRGSASKDETHNSLTRVESKKDLQQVFKSVSSQHQQHQQPANLEKHFVKEELVILENIHDSSGTPGDFQFITKQSNNLNQSNAQPKILHIQDDQVQNLQLNQPSMTEYQDSKAYGEDFDNAESHEQEPPLIVQNQISQKQQKFNSFGSGKKPNKQFPAQQQLQLQQNQVKPDVVPITEEDITQDTLTLGNNQQRIQNSSIAQVKSPIGTTTSFKSQNSAQQAGAYQDHIEKFPMRPGKALKLYLNQLTDYEKGEILDYQDIYFLGLQAAKVHGSPKEEFNYGYDDDKGDYKVITKDHIGYRYEVLEFIGKGSFGTALKCFDHKTKEQVALKIVKNKKKYAYQAGIELKILNFLKENDPDDIMNVIHMKDYVIFRKHLCISFELLSMNLFEFLKINDFNGFDHNLIRRFAIQLLYALKYLREFQIIHCDLKPENILLKEANKSGIKIIDFGSSTFLDERVYTYIQSRFYRAPEIMLGIPYTCAIDMWSFGCIMAELYIGYPIFPGESENDQMSRIIEMVDKPNQTVYDISQRRAKFFTENADTGDYEPIMLKNSRGKLRKPGGKPLSLLLGDEDLDFLDFVQKCLEWDPEVRLTPDEALRHIWILKGLPPQVLVHHQRMHNIATPELPQSVREARDKFFQEANIQQQQQNTSQPGANDSQAQQHSGQVQPSKNDGSSQLGGGASSSGNRFSTGGKTQNLQQQQSQTQQQRPSLQNTTQQQQQLTSKGLGSSKQHTNIKAETIKSLERAQLKNQLHQLNPNKHSNQASSQKTGALANIALHSKILTSQQPQGQVLTDTHRSDHSSNLLTSTANTARVNLQQQLAQIQAQNQQQLRQNPPHLQLLPNMSTQQYSTLNSNISPNKGGVTSVFPLEGTQFVNSGKFAAGFKRRSHQATTAAVRHQRNNLLGNAVGGAGGGGLIQRPQDALTH